ncbi:hypothetical protein Pdw03_0807 [Penicillium digitatum]|uniref:Uncharacterized protein n=1 Tax=Penicillium digitatum TaxID=36651 RepID=A0A7T6XRK1_PENDI|nr:hypothetical protein Pdw03_0807 [Penicillium digitatum]
MTLGTNPVPLLAPTTPLVSMGTVILWTQDLNAATRDLSLFGSWPMPLVDKSSPLGASTRTTGLMRPEAGTEVPSTDLKSCMRSSLSTPTMTPMAAPTMVVMKLGYQFKNVEA